MGSNGKEHRRGVPRPPPLSLYIEREKEEAAMAGGSGQRLVTRMHQLQVSTSNNKKRILSKQLSMKETTREVKWEKRRRQIQRRIRSSVDLQDADDEGGGSANIYATADSEASSSTDRVPKSLTDEDLDELRGSMELGFGFVEGNGGQNLCDTIPALDLYFAVNRQLSEPKQRLSTSSPTSATSSSSTLCVTSSNPGSPVAPSSSTDNWKICSPGDNPQLVKTRLRHWAQVVACSVKHSS
ncbi:hypothetical protein GUJ93_ZPchr0004g38997 [Zizania palustris]|uniref:Uncharacterized protein n=1 Tax=Zizania palustris TaxID=103762 RepID=A0A8J5SHY4_ZIZPA|nr:hypothetical protein GUJ93_ZPchr0004g38997 [Zizania palustris]